MKKALTKSTLRFFLGIAIIVFLLYGCAGGMVAPDTEPLPLQSGTVQLSDLNEG